MKHDDLNEDDKDPEILANQFGHGVITSAAYGSSNYLRDVNPHLAISKEWHYILFKSPLSVPLDRQLFPQTNTQTPASYAMPLLGTMTDPDRKSVV